MFWGILVTILAQITNGTVSVFDKFMLQRSLRPTNFAFWIALTSLSVFVLLPFNFAWPNGAQWYFDLAAGATFIFAVFFMYIAMEREEITRVVPVIGCLTPVFTLFISSYYLKDSLNLNQIVAVIIILAGIFLLTYQHSKKPIHWLIFSSAFVAAFLFALSAVLMKNIFSDQAFIPALAWSRLGGVIIIPFVLLDRQTRSDIFKNREMPRKGNLLIFGLGRIFSASGFILVNYAYFLLNPTIVNALQGIQYAYLFMATLLLSRFWPQILTEKISRPLLFTKISGIALIILGTVILALNS
jgi:drug/metabolite transporter (DMT)-like permease